MSNNDYMEAAEGTRKALEAENARLERLVSHWQGLAVTNRKVADDALAQLAAIQQAKGEEVEVVAWQDAENPLYTTAERRVMHEWANNQYQIVELMTVAQHQRITAAMAAEVETWRSNALMLEQANVGLAQPLPPGTKLYTAPQPAPAQDVAGLVNALKTIYDEDYQVPHDSTDDEIKEGMKRCIFRIRRIVKDALAAHDKQSGGEE